MNASLSAVLMFISTVLVVSVGMAYLIYCQLFLPLALAQELNHWWPRALTLLLWLGIVLYMANLRLGFMPVYSFMPALIGILGLFFVVAVPVALLRWALPHYQIWFALVGLVVAIGLVAVALWEGARAPAVVKVDVKLDKWQGPPLRMVQLTDLHLGQGRGADKAQEIVQETMALKPDVIVVTGDLIDGKQVNAFAAIAPLKGLSAPLGVYYVTGNHENYLSYTEQLLAHLKTDFHWQVLMNQHVRVIRPNNQFFQIVGISDYSGSQMDKYPPDPAQAFSGSDSRLATVLLAHQPRQWQSTAAFHPDLTLSGHTHGGQIWPFTYLVKLQQPWVSGLHQVEGGFIYVSTGTGLWGPPMRLFTRAEITELTLHR